VWTLVGELGEDHPKAIETVERFGQGHLERASTNFVRATEALRDRSLLYGAEAGAAEEPRKDQPTAGVGHSEEARDDMAEFEAVINKMMLTSKLPTDDDAVANSNMMATFKSHADQVGQSPETGVVETQDEQESSAHVDGTALLDGLSPVLQSVGTVAPPLSAKLKMDSPLSTTEAEVAVAKLQRSLQSSLKVSKAQVGVLGVTQNRLEIYFDLFDGQPTSGKTKESKSSMPSADELYVEIDLQLQDIQSYLHSRSEFAEYLKAHVALQRLMADERWAAECMRENRKLGRSVVLDGTARKPRKNGYEPPPFDPTLPGTLLTEEQGVSTLDPRIREVAPPARLTDEMLAQTLPPSAGAHKGESAWFIPAGPHRTPSLLKDEDLANHRM
ncbi:hypothetical protein FOZ63_028732, partial [Perkinsus olseni]